MNNLINYSIMTQFITIDNFSIPEVYSENNDNIYNPDYTVKRRSNSHTMRKNVSEYSHEYNLNIVRPKCTNGAYVTAVDEYLDYYDIRSNHPYRVNFALHKNELYDRFIFEIEEKCVEKTISYDKHNNMNKTKYKVPAVGMIVDLNNNHTNTSHETMIDGAKNDLHKYLMIRGKTYAIGKYFQEFGLDFHEIHLPENYFSTGSICEDGETSYCPTKTNFSKDVLTYSFHHDMKISSIVVQPELMKFKKVTGDNRINSKYDRMNPRILRKKNHHINVLENDPGFISKFEMFYRSDLTNGLWVKHGIFNGNVSISDFTKISFDEIMAKEIRIVPLSFHKSYEHIRISFIGKCDMTSKSDEIFVTYEISVPRDGKYIKYSSKVCDSNIYTHATRDWKKIMIRDKKRFQRHTICEKIKYDA